MAIEDDVKALEKAGFKRPIPKKREYKKSDEEVIAEWLERTKISW